MNKKLNLSVSDILEPNIDKSKYDNVDIMDYENNMCFSTKQYTLSIANLDDKFYLIMCGTFISDVYEIKVTDSGVFIDENKKMFADYSNFKFSLSCQIPTNAFYHIGTINRMFPVMYAKSFVNDFSIESAMAYLKSLLLAMGYLPGTFIKTNSVDEFKNILLYKYDSNKNQAYIPTATECYTHNDIMSILRLVPDVDYYPDYIGKNDSIYRLKNNLSSIGFVLQGIAILNVFCNMLIIKENIEIFSPDIIDIYNDLYRALAKFVPRDKYISTIKSAHMYMPYYFNRDMCNIVTRHGREIW